MNNAIWWFGAIVGSISAVLGAAIVLGALAEIAVRRAGWLPDFYHFLVRRNRERRQAKDSFYGA